MLVYNSTGGNKWNKEDKAVAVQAWRGPEGSRRFWILVKRVNLGEMCVCLCEMFVCLGEMCISW